MFLSVFGLLFANVFSHTTGYQSGGFDIDPFTFEFPKTRRSIPEPLPRGVKPGFEFRGIKGWKWRPQQYLNIVPFLAAHKMNFLMNCYTNMCDIEHFAWGDPRGNRWWEPVPREKKAWMEKLVSLCKRNGVQFCFSMNPSLASSRPIDYESKTDLEALWKQYEWMQGQGVRWFNISLDDISKGIDGAGQVRVVNEIFRRLRVKDPEVQFIFCPTWYWGYGKEPEKRAYFESIANHLNRDVYLFWTGETVIGPISKAAAESYKMSVKHRLFLWDNYPVNDDNPTMHLGPVIHRDKDLCKVIDGYMSNSMCQEEDSNRIPLLTCADYAFNPYAYEPQRSAGQAIMNLAQTQEQRSILRDLVQAYPGDLSFFHGQYNSSYNSVRERFRQLKGNSSTAHAAKVFFDHIEQLAKRLGEVYPNRFLVERKLVESDVAWMRGQV